MYVLSELVVKVREIYAAGYGVPCTSSGIKRLHYHDLRHLAQLGKTPMERKASLSHDLRHLAAKTAPRRGANGRCDKIVDATTPQSLSLPEQPHNLAFAVNPRLRAAPKAL